MSLTRDTYNNFGEIHNSQELDWMFPSRAIIILSQPYLSLFSVDLLSQPNFFYNNNSFPRERKNRMSLEWSQK